MLLHTVPAYGLGNSWAGEIDTDPLAVSKSAGLHLANSDFSTELQSEITRLGLQRIAGNVFSCPSSKDFWQIRKGKIVRITSAEVDNGDHLEGAPEDSPQNFLQAALDDLTL